MTAVKSLRSRALDLLSRREMSQAELRRKLAPYAEDPAEIDALLQEFADRNWQSDQRYAESYVYSKSSRYGRLRLAQGLQQQKLDNELIAATLPDRDSERTTACAVLAKKFKQPPADWNERQRAARFLAYRGFDHDTIRHALAHAWAEPPPALPDDEWFGD